MACRCLIALALCVAVPGAAATGFTVGVCFSEIPGSSCSPIECEYRHGLTLDGPLPGGSSRDAEYVRGAIYCYQFHDVAPGSYVIRTGGCNPFGCWTDTPVEVVDQDVGKQVHQIAHTPTATRQVTTTPTESPIRTSTATAPLADTPTATREPVNTPTVTPVDTFTATAPPACLGDGDGDRQVTIDELVGAVNNAIGGCP